MNTTTFRSKTKKAAQYGVVAPGIAVGTFAYATAKGIKHIAVTTGKTFKAIGHDIVANTKSYVSDIKQS